MKILTYDIEILRAILNGQTEDDFQEEYPGIEYCRSFQDFDQMGIGCLCALANYSKLPLIYDAKNIAAFRDEIAKADVIVSYNGDSFDAKVLAANGITIPAYKSLDLLAEIKRADGVRFSLDAMAECNLGYGKNGSGKMAPIRWQQGHYAEVIQYCLNDVLMTQELYTLAREQGHLRSPKGSVLKLELDRALVASLF